MRFDIIVYDGVDELDFVGPMEILRAAADPDVEVRICARATTDPIVGSFGLRILPDTVFVPGESDVVIVPGGRWVSKGAVGAWGEVQRGDWLPLLRAAADSGATMVSVCTGALLLAHAGVIGTRPCTTHFAARDDLRATGASVLDERVVDNGDLITGAGVTSGLDVALHLVERFLGTAAAVEASRRAEYPPT